MPRSLVALLPVALIALLLAFGGGGERSGTGFSPDATRLADCAPGSLACYRQAFGNIAYERGGRAALDALRTTIGDDRSVYDACHPITHAIGVATLEREGGDAEAALVDADPLCQSGFAHAIVEREIALVEDPDPSAAAARLGRYCERSDLWADALARAECLHGIGHGLLLARDGDLPFVLDACAAMTESLGYGWLRYCILGAFMELNAPIAPIDLRWLRADRPEFPCDQLDERYAVTCYGQYAARLLRSGDDQLEVASSCRAISLEAGRVECMISLLLTLEPRDERPERIGAICAAASPYEHACLSGYVRGRRDRSPLDPSASAAICAGLATDPAASDHRRLSRACARAIGYEFRSLEPSVRCAALAIESLVAACAEAATRPEEAESFLAEPAG